MRPETEDMRDWLERTFLPRYEAGWQEHRTDNVLGPVPLNVRNAIEEVADAAFYLRQLERTLDGDGIPPELIYVAGPYTASSNGTTAENIAVAMEAGAELYRRGYAPFIPHTMTASFDELFPDIPKQVYIKTDLLYLSLCPSMLMLIYWEESPGAQTEHNVGVRLEKRIYYNLDDVPDLT